MKEKLPPSKARLIAEELQAMKAEGVRVSPKTLLQRARAKGSRLHDSFEWDDSIAAAKWRLEQAREFIASVTITVKEVEYPVRAWSSVAITTKTGSGRREWFERDTILKDGAKMASLSADYYSQFAALARNVRGQMLHKHDRAWDVICRAIEENVPTACR